MILHIKRANFKSFIWKKALVAYSDLQSPINHGWVFGKNSLHFQWTHNEMMPTDLAELMVIDSFNVEKDDNENDPPTCSFEDLYYEMDY